MNKRSIAAVAVATAALLPAGALAKGEKPIRTGDYEGTPKVAGSQSYSVSEFGVGKSKGKRFLTSPSGYSGIYHPDAGKCDPYDVPLSAAKVPVSKSGRFHVKDSYPIADGNKTDVIKVDWKGHWTKAILVKGTIKISFKNCTDSRTWTGNHIG